MSSINPHLKSRGSRAPSQASTTNSQALSTTRRTETRSSPGNHRPPVHPPPHSPRPKPPSARTSGVAHRGKPCVHPRHAGNPAAAPGGGALPGIPRRVDASPPQRSLAAAAAAASRGPRQPPPAPGWGPPLPRRCPGGEKSQSSEARQLPEGRPQNTGHPALRPPGLHTPQT